MKQFAQRPYDPTKNRRFVHSPFTVEHDGYKVSCDKDGKVTIDNKELNASSEFDEITIPASLVFKLANMLDATRKVKYIDKEK